MSEFLSQCSWSRVFVSQCLNVILLFKYIKHHLDVAGRSQEGF